jgi:hypothetical protein
MLSFRDSVLYERSVAMLYCDPVNKQGAELPDLYLIDPAKDRSGVSMDCTKVCHKIVHHRTTY